MLINIVVPGIEVSTGMLVSEIFLCFSENQTERENRRDAIKILTPV